MDRVHGAWQAGRDILLLVGGAAGLAAMAVWWRDSRGPTVFLVAAMLIALAPSLPLTISVAGIESERFVYPATIFSWILVPMALATVLPRRPALAVLGVVTLGQAAFLHQSNRAWRDAGDISHRVLTLAPRR